MHTKKNPVKAEMAMSHRKALDKVKGEVQKSLPHAKIRYNPMASDKSMNVSFLLKATKQSKLVDGFLKNERTIIEDIVSKTSEELEVDMTVSIEKATATTQQRANSQASNILLSIAASSNASVDVTAGGRSTTARLTAP